MRVLIADGNNLGWRGSVTTPLTHNGRRTEVIYSGLNIIRAYLDRFHPDECIVVWDGGRDKRRTSIYPQYKKKKKEYTEVEKRERAIFYEQLERLRKVFSKLGIFQYRVPGREADDVIFTLLHYAIPPDSETECFVISTDKDFYQLFAWWKDVILYNPVKKRGITYFQAVEELGFDPEDYVLYRALVGDPSDNLPGVRGIGEVKAKKLLSFLESQTTTLSEKELKKLMDILEKEEKQLELMVDLVNFKLLSREELNKGIIEAEAIDSPEKFYEQLMLVCDSFGFERILDNISQYAEPFIALHRKRRAK